MARLINVDKLEAHEMISPLGNGMYESTFVVYKDDIDEQPTVDAIPIEWLKSKYPLHGVYGTEDYFHKAHFVEQLIKEWNAENHNVDDREEKDD